MWWAKYAWCRNFDPELFFPISTEDTTLGILQREEAKAVCDQCPVSRECLAYALKTQQSDGVWGGLSEEERKVIMAAVSR